MNSIQSPQILSDLYRDLRERRLLPLVVVLVVGMAVVPIALSSSPKSTPGPLPPAPVAAKANAPSEAVVVANPGLRDYKKRLAGDTSKDPFIQQFTASASAGSAAATGSGSGSTGETSPAGTDTTSGSTGSTGSSGTGSSGGTTTSAPQPQTQSKYFFYRVKVRAGKLGQGLKTYDSVGSLAPLPSKKVPAVTFLGVNTDNAFEAKTAVFLVSSAVSSADRRGKLLVRGQRLPAADPEAGPARGPGLGRRQRLPDRPGQVQPDCAQRRSLHRQEGVRLRGARLRLRGTRRTLLQFLKPRRYTR